MQEVDDICRRLFTGENRDMRIASITFGKLRASVTRQQRNDFIRCIQAIEEHVQEGVACVEAGDQRFRLHVQCMLYLLISKAESAADDLKALLLKKMEETEAGKITGRSSSWHSAYVR